MPSCISLQERIVEIRGLKHAMPHCHVQKWSKHEIANGDYDRFGVQQLEERTCVFCGMSLRPIPPCDCGCQTTKNVEKLLGSQPTRNLPAVIQRENA